MAYSNATLISIRVRKRVVNYVKIPILSST